MTAIITVENLVKVFPKVRAVDAINFQIEEGTCFGLLGPNGAGKTTTMEIIEGVQDATSGTILYRGDPRDGRFKQNIGIQFQSTALPDFLTVREVLQLFKGFYTASRSIEEIVDICSLGDFLDRDNRKLSGGQRQRLLLGVALVSDPAVLFLDEPTTGLDPQARRNFWKLIGQIKAQKKTVVLSTHYMEEAYELCDALIIMDHGRIIAEGEPRELLRRHFDETVVQIPTDHTQGADLSPWRHRQSGDMTEIITKDVSKVLTGLVEQNIDLSYLQVKPKTLEDLFIDLTGSALRS